MPATQPIRYSDDLEVELPGEAAVIEETVATMRHTLEQTFELHRHGTSATHAKSHGIVTGSLTVPDGLPAELAQGLFALPATYEVVLRYASEPGAIDPDTVRRARGLALKVLGVPGPKLRPDWTSQDFLFNTWPTIPQGDAKTFLDSKVQQDRHLGDHTKVALGTALHHPSPKQTLFDRTPNVHPLGFTYYSQAAFRYGDFVAKFALAPVSAEQLAVADREVGKDDPPGVLREWVAEYYAAHPAAYEFRVQLLTDLDTMPIEDAAVEWPEKVSPYRTVARITVPPQETFSAARRTYAEDVMSWRPWYGLTAHRPLGSINRVRNRAYAELGAWRHAANAAAETDPAILAEVPA